MQPKRLSLTHRLQTIQTRRAQRRDDYIRQAILRLRLASG